jgi:hypothetical protein
MVARVRRVLAWRPIKDRASDPASISLADVGWVAYLRAAFSRYDPRFWAIACALPFLMLAAWEFSQQDYTWEGGTYSRWGMDLALYVSRASAFLDTGTPYSPWQVTGEPYAIGGEVWLYPPTTLLLAIPFIWVPALAWWLIPFGIFACALWRWRPSLWIVPVLAMILAWPRTVGAISAGNTDMWVVAAVSLGLIWGWPLALVLLKPSVVPLLLLGIGSPRPVFAGLALVAGGSLLFLPLWPSFVIAAPSAETPGILYSLPNLPMLLAPVAAYLLATRRADRSARFRWIAARTLGASSGGTGRPWSAAGTATGGTPSTRPQR